MINQNGQTMADIVRERRRRVLADFGRVAAFVAVIAFIAAGAVIGCRMHACRANGLGATCAGP